jgi:hypothetical protein
MQMRWVSPLQTPEAGEEAEGQTVKKPNSMDSRNRDARQIMEDLQKMGKEPCRLTIAGSHKLDAKDAAEALCDAWDEITDLIGFEPKRIITGCSPVGAEKAARLAAKSLTGKLAVVFHRPELIHSVKQADMFMNVVLSKGGDALLLLANGSKPACKNLREQFQHWQKKIHQVEVG